MRLTRWLTECLNLGLNLLMPPQCAFCQTPLSEVEPDAIFCKTCRQEILPQNGQYCFSCGSYFLVPPQSSLWAGIPPNERCLACQSNTHVFSNVIVLGEYEGMLRDIVLAMKHQKDGFFGRACSSFLFTQHHDLFQKIGADLILPVPMHFARRFLRGVNSPDFIAQRLSELLRIPYNSHLLYRRFGTVPQFELYPNQRLANVKNAFQLRSRIGPVPFWKKTATFLAGKKILLVDDILTTGATCNEIARLLLHHGVSSVAVAVLARTRGLGPVDEYRA